MLERDFWVFSVSLSDDLTVYYFKFEFPTWVFI